MHQLKAVLRAAQLCLIVCCISLPACAHQASVPENFYSPQTSAADSPSSPGQQNHSSYICGLKHLDRCFVDLAHDQAGIWTSPLRLRPHDAFWLVPFGAATGAAFYYDKQALQELGHDKNRVDISRKLSNIGSGYALAGAGAGMYFLGSINHNDHLAETGRLGLEAVVGATLVDEVLKLATNRERPDTGTGAGRFWPHGPDHISLSSSFPSGHAIASWSLARVVAAEYPNKFVQIGAYGLATLVSISRVTGREHFPSDALVGSTLGYLIGGYVVRHHAATYHDQNYSFLPVIDERTHTYGMTLAFHP